MSIAKQFEHNIAYQMEQIPNVYVQRLYDTMNIYGVCNPCDYIVYKNPHIYLLEMKTTAGNILPFANISKGQIDGLSKASRIRGVVAGILVWYYDKNITRFLPIQLIEELMQTNKKSIRFDYKDDRIIDIQGQKKKIYYEYDWKKFFKESGDINETLSSLSTRSISNTRKTRSRRTQTQLRCKRWRLYI